MRSCVRVAICVGDEGVAPERARGKERLPPMEASELLPRSRRRLRWGLYREDRGRLDAAVEAHLEEVRRLERAWHGRGWDTRVLRALVLGDQLDVARAMLRHADVVDGVEAGGGDAEEI